MATEAVDLDALESEVYDHLYSFFRRYYSEGDFLSKRVYKPGVYAIPYEGEEVKLHWANSDQYYIKTSEYLRDYAFRLRPEDEKNPMRVHFKLVDAAEGEHGNIKAAEGKDRVFILAPGGDSGRDFIAEEAGELTLRFEYRPAVVADWLEGDGRNKPPAQKDLLEIAVKRIEAVSDAALASWHSELGKPHVRADGEKADYNRLRAHLNRYTARNTFDYFIHKDLDGFLRRELDFYIKNEVMHLDDIENESAPRVEQYLSKIKVIRSIAGKIVDFLAQLEEFQKKIWLKRKFVVETRYCVTLDRVPKHFYAEIIANPSQWREWVQMYDIEEKRQRTSRPPSVEVLNPYYMLDTRHFPSEFVERLLSEMENLDQMLDGLCVNSENSQALRLLKTRFSENVDCIYIDPPYNTSEASLLYKNEYRHSSWLAMVEQSLLECYSYMKRSSVAIVAIDDFEKENLSKCLDHVFSPAGRLGTLVVETKPSGRTNDRFFATSHEYHLFFGLPESTAEITFFPLSDDAKRQYAESDEGGGSQVERFLTNGWIFDARGATKLFLSNLL